MPILEVKSVRRRAGGKLGYVSQGPWMSPTCAAPGHCQSSQSVQSLRAGCEAEAHDQLEGPTHALRHWRRWRYADRGIRRGAVGRSPHPAGTQCTKSQMHTSLNFAPRQGVLGSSRGVKEWWVGPVFPEGCRQLGCNTHWACQSALCLVRG